MDFVAFFPHFAHFTMKHWNMILNKINTNRDSNQASGTFIQSMIYITCNTIDYFIIISIVINKI